MGLYNKLRTGLKPLGLILKAQNLNVLRPEQLQGQNKLDRIVKL